MYEIPKRGPYPIWGKWSFYPNFAPASASQACIFFNFACRVHMIITRQMTCKIYGIFKSFFNLRVLYCTPNLFCPFDHQPTVAAQGCFISYLFLFLDFKSDMMGLCSEYTCFPKKVSVCGKSDILIQFQAPSVYLETFET